MDDGFEKAATYIRRTDQRIGEAVVTTIADANGVSPLDLEPLATVIDPDALDTIVASMPSLPDEPTARVEFQYSGYNVTVAEDGEISLTELGPDGG